MDDTGYWIVDCSWDIRCVNYRVRWTKIRCRIESGSKYIWKNTVWAALFIVWFCLNCNVYRALALADEY